MATRLDWLKGWLEETAKEGRFNADTRLSKEEAEAASNEWKVTTILTGKEPDKNGYYSYKISWRYALDSKRLDEEKKAYIEKRSWRFPEVESFAQRLYLIAKRAETK